MMLISLVQFIIDYKLMKSQTGNLIKKFLIWNSFLLLYIIIPNCIAFISFLILIGIIFNRQLLEKAINQFSSIVTRTLEKINVYFTSFLKLNLLKQILVIIVFKFIADVLLLLPTWLLLLTTVQFCVFWTEINQIVKVPSFANIVERTEEAVDRLIQNFPAYHKIC